MSRFRRSVLAALNFISQQEHYRIIPFMQIIKDPNRDSTPSTCDPIVTLVTAPQHLVLHSWAQGSRSNIITVLQHLSFFQNLVNTCCTCSGRQPQNFVCSLPFYLDFEITVMTSLKVPSILLPPPAPLGLASVSCVGHTFDNRDNPILDSWEVGNTISPPKTPALSSPQKNSLVLARQREVE